jgi:hypothetical protein
VDVAITLDCQNHVVRFLIAERLHWRKGDFVSDLFTRSRSGSAFPYRKTIGFRVPEGKVS